MTDITNDPVAAAAAQLQDAAPSSTEPTIIERIEEGLHSLEAKVEHLIHPESAPEVSTQAPEVAAEQPGESITGPSSSEQSPSTNATAELASRPSSDIESSNSGSNAASSNSTPSSEVSATASSPESEDDLPNGDAQSAGSLSVDATASSALPALPVVAMPAASDSGVRERALQAIGKLRAHFWTFERSAVQHLHNELDFLEELFK